MNFLSFLDHLVDQGVQGGAGYLEGRQLRADDDAARQAKQAKDARENAVADALMDLHKAQAEKARQPVEKPAPDAFIDVAGRKFPNNEEGVAAAQAWDRTLNPGKYRTPTPPRAPTIGLGTGDVVEYLKRLDQVEGVRDRHERQSNPPIDPRRTELRGGLTAKLGKPTTRAQQRALDELEGGKTPDQIINDMRRRGVPVAIRNEVGDYLTPPDPEAGF